MSLLKRMISKYRNDIELPDSLGWENMSEGIYDKMEEKDTKKMPYSNNRRYRYLLLLLLLMAGVWGCHSYLNKIDDEEPQLEYTIDQAKQGSDETLRNVFSPNLSSKENYKEEPIVIKIKENEVVSNEQSIESNNPIVSVKSVIEKTNSKLILIGEGLSDKTNNSEILYSYLDTTMSESILATSQLIHNSLAPISSLNIKFFETIFVNHSIDDLGSLLPFDKKGHNDLYPKWQINALSGSSLLFANNQSVILSDDLQISESSLQSVNLALGLTHYFNKTLFIKGSLNWARSFSRYDFSQVKVSSRLIEGHTIEIRTNPLTGRSRSILGEYLNTVRETRELRNYNSIVHISVASEFGIVKRKGKAAYQISVGTLYSKILRAEGKAYFNEQLVEYSDAEARFNSSPLFGLSSSIRVSYGLSEKLNVGANLGYVRYLKNWSHNNAESIEPKMLSSSISLGYNLN